ncbi:alpha-(1,3)-fucosyltransferase C-like [Zerene cesonia]|uniref:alpha-(1,3)-fucosyltransferase C-like n=1 Tax=Zerene cesonia TaxID=33412 RepID=UPI0018E595BC|nr:alpha-(1,3)-fucosyltransferase C-like [Zerene cesonia]
MLKILTWPIRSFSRIFIFLILIYAWSLLCLYNSKLYDIRAKRREILSYTNHRNFKYILQWTRRFSAPFDYLSEGNAAFVKNKCNHTNCYVTDDKNYFLDQREFDAIVFNGKDVIHLWPFQMPAQRSPKQKFIFGAMESPDNFPACDEHLDGYFNWTWTYKLDSDFRWAYITIFDLNGTIVGPNIGMNWPKHMDEIGDELKTKLSRKTKAVAWFVSHCSTRSRREDFVADLDDELNRYGLSVDVYGSCGTLSCPRSDERSCFKMIEDKYHFYLSFENSFSEDYVTEKLLTALNNYAVPIVFGAADYTRFVPEGSYLNARELGPKKLAQAISDIIANKSRYYDFFRWRNHFVYKGTDEVDVCHLCDMLNNEQKVNEMTVWQDFRVWWNGARYKENCF